MSVSKPAKPQREAQRIAKLLARAGIASRREIERMIVDGRVALNGVTLDTPATLLTSLHGVTVDGQPVFAPAPARLFIYHKPTGLLVTERDPKGRPTIYDRLPPDLPRLVPVGRLDLNTEGLLLLTTDGELKRQLELPATGVERTYRARTYGPITQDRLEELIEGIEIEGIRYGSIDANLERRTGANTWIELTLKEGKNREVRRVLDHLGLQVSRLIRTRYGPFILGDLPPGEIGEVRQHAVIAFRKNPTAAEIHIAPQERREIRDQRAAAEAEARPAPPPRPSRPGRPVRPGARPPAKSARPERPTERAPAKAGARPFAKPAPAGKPTDRATGPRPFAKPARPGKPTDRPAPAAGRPGKFGDPAAVRPERPEVASEPRAGDLADRPRRARTRPNKPRRPPRTRK